MEGAARAVHRARVRRTFALALPPSEGNRGVLFLETAPCFFVSFIHAMPPSLEGQLGPLITGDKNSSNTLFGTEKRAGGEGINP